MYRHVGPCVAWGHRHTHKFTQAVTLQEWSVSYHSTLFNVPSLNEFLSFWLDDIMALHTLNYRHTLLLLLQPTEGGGERENEREKGKREGGRWWGQSCPYLVILLCFNPTFILLPTSVCFSFSPLDPRFLSYEKLLSYYKMCFELRSVCMSEAWFSCLFPCCLRLCPSPLLASGPSQVTRDLWPLSWKFRYFPSILVK